MLINKVKRFQNESFYKWFDDFCEDYKLKDEIIENAKKGYGGMQLELPRDEVYRFRNIQFIPLLKEYLGEGFKLEIETQRLGLMTNTKHFLIIEWSVEQ